MLSSVLIFFVFSQLEKEQNDISEPECLVPWSLPPVFGHDAVLGHKFNPYILWEFSSFVNCDLSQDFVSEHVFVLDISLCSR
jgi:hypothetical protein